MAIEDLIAADATTAINALGLFGGAVTAEVVNFPAISREQYAAERIYVYPVGTERELQTRAAHRVDGLIGVLVGKRVDRTSEAEQTAIATAGESIENALFTAFQGYRWISGTRSRYDTEWLENGIFASTIFATFRRAGVKV